MSLVLDGDNGVNLIQNGQVVPADLSTGGPSWDSSGNLTVSGAINGSVNATNGMGFKNRLINGDMRIDQRNAGASQTITSGAVTYAVDRWLVYATGANITSQQTTGTGQFVNSWKLTGASSNTDVLIGQRIESKNVSDLSGTTVTVQAYIWGSASGSVSWGMAYANSVDNFAATTDISTGTISITTTPTLYTFTVSSLPSGVTNGISIRFDFGALGSGVTRNITGVQLEKGSTATSFDYRPYGTELQLCQRYYYRMQPLTANSIIFGSGYADSTTRAITNHSLPVVMRTSPTAGYSAASTFSFAVPSGNPICTSVSVFRASPYQISTNFICSGGGFTAGWGLLSGDAGTTSAYIDASAEL